MAEAFAWMKTTRLPCVIRKSATSVPRSVQRAKSGADRIAFSWLGACRPLPGARALIKPKTLAGSQSSFTIAVPFSEPIVACPHTLAGLVDLLEQTFAVTTQGERM